MNCLQTFRFKKFSVCQDGAAMKIGTDGVLLGAWSNCNNALRILDIGTGTGVIALMMAQRFPNAEIEAVEIEEQASQTAQKNFINSPWKERLTVFCTPIQKYKPSYTYDLIVCNPPFFDEKVAAKGLARQTARQTVFLDLAQIFGFASKYLSETGNLSIIFPKSKEKYLWKEAAKYKLFPSRITNIRGRSGLPEKRILVELKKEKNEPVITSLCIEKERHIYTESYINLVKDFYLKM